jgi:hypothetical protein
MPDNARLGTKGTKTMSKNRSHDPYFNFGGDALVAEAKTIMTIEDATLRAEAITLLRDETSYRRASVRDAVEKALTPETSTRDDLKALLVAMLHELDAADTPAPTFGGVPIAIPSALTPTTLAAKKNEAKKGLRMTYRTRDGEIRNDLVSALAWDSFKAGCGKYSDLKSDLTAYATA